MHQDDIQMVYDDEIDDVQPPKSLPQKTRLEAVEYKVIWFDNQIPERRFQVAIKVSSPLVVRDFIQITIGEFNQLFRKEGRDLFFFNNDSTVFELCELDATTERPDDEYPPYDEQQQLRKINSRAFAFKAIQIHPPELGFSSLSDPYSIKSPSSEEEKINPAHTQIQDSLAHTETSITGNLQNSEIKKNKKTKVGENRRCWGIFCCCIDDEE